MVHVKRLPENVSKDGSLRDAHVVLTLWAVRPLACHVGKFDETYSEFRETSSRNAEHVTSCARARRQSATI